MLPAHVPTLENRPIRLRAFDDRDRPLILSVAGDPVIPVMTSVPDSACEADARDWIGRQHGRIAEGFAYSFCIADHATDEGVGQIALLLRDLHCGRVSTGYWIAPQFRGRRYVVPALEALVDWVDDLEEIGRLELFVEPANVASWRAAEHCGFQREGLLRSWQLIDGIRRDMYVYSHIPDHVA